MRIIFVGNLDETLGFKLAGIETIPVKNKQEFTEIIELLFNQKDVGIIVIADRFFEIFSEKFSSKIKKKAIPSIVFVPSIDGIHLKRSLREYIANVLGIRL